MTDLIKDFEEVASGKMMKFLRDHPDFEEDNVQKLREEIAVLGVTRPVLIAFGKDAEFIARRHLGCDFKIVGIPHYANYVSKENYRQQVGGQLPPLTTTSEGAEPGDTGNAASTVLGLGRQVARATGSSAQQVV